MSKLKMGNYYLDKKSIFTILKTNKDTKKKKFIQFSITVHL